MRSWLVTLLAAALLLVPVGAASGQPERRAPLVSAEDTSGDVIVRDLPGPSGAERRSIDLLELKAVPRGDAVRFTFRIAEVTTSPDFDQLLTVVLVDAEPDEERTEGQVTLRVQHARRGLAQATLDTDHEGFGVACLGFPVQVVRPRALVKLDVFKHCLPPGLLSVRAKSFTTTPRGEPRTVYSRDFLRVPGSVDLGGTVGSDGPQP
jgi:hypothetical protein